ncbi:MAG: hypothetical protein JWM68_3053 [Verrucomicrobiales bacterium]|nr:hypothetical protein [Verrucomicrobiales bacterium]
MNAAPLDLALKHISETRHLLEMLILSSESFDYPKAKLALKELERKTRDLAKIQAALSNEKRVEPANITFVPFRAAS